MPRRRSRGRRPALLASLIVVLGIVVAGAIFLVNQINRPLPAIIATPKISSVRHVDGDPPTLPWPGKGGAAVSVGGLGLIGAHGDETPRPIASTAKIMTGLVILDSHPLTPTQSGPLVTITAADVASYRSAIAQDQSVVPVVEGEKLSEYQLLQGLLLPSGNNIADILAKWDAGSVDAFVAKMNAKAASLGMAHTHYADASGFSPHTVSTPPDLLIVGEKAMTNPVFSAIVAQAETTLPAAGTVYNVNAILGQEGNVGIKTGSTDEAGACFVAAAKQTVNGRTIDVYAAVMGQDLLAEAFQSTKDLTGAVSAGLRTAQVLSRTEVIASYTPPWGGQIDVVPAGDVEFLAWPGMAVTTTLQLESLMAPQSAGTVVGSLTLQLGKQSQRVDLVTTAPLEEPERRWRLTRFLMESWQQSAIKAPIENVLSTGARIQRLIRGFAQALPL